MPGRNVLLNPVCTLATFLAIALVVMLWPGCTSTGPYGRGAGAFGTVVVDAGHGGHDRGARAVRGSYEKVLALDTALRLRTILQRAGYKVILTRSGDYFVPLGQRVDVSGRAPNAIFVSIHYNWARRGSASGIETYFYSPNSARLAANIQKELLRAYGATNRGVKNRGFYVLRNNRRPAVLIECGFLSNSGDNRFAQNPDYRQRIAEHIARGIIAERHGKRP
jgi:N-acetylmuramoyl-L-alanine amidase